MREQKLLLKTYLSLQSKAKQTEIYNEYFSICNLYQTYIRENTIRTREKWEIRYASFLLKANIVSGIPDKLHILEKGYEILNRNKDSYPKKYLKAACNLAGDYMWRDKIECSHSVLESAVSLIEKKNLLQQWGIIYQMLIFSKLYGNISVSPQELFADYTKKIWNRPEIKSKMHEMVICNSNYAILLAASGNFKFACSLLQKTLNELDADWNYYNEYLVSTNLGMMKYLLGDVSGALMLETHCKELIDKKKVPTFSYAFIKKRTHILHDIYLEKKPIDNVLVPLNAQQTLSTGYCSDNYFRPLLFSDINYWTD
jgi:tetratricopeptide (TPR) repeat protein